MESTENPIGRSEAQAALAALSQAESARARLAKSLRLPSFFHTSIGAAIAIQIASGATGLAHQETWGLPLLAGGLLVFVLVGAVQLARFRRLNGAWLRGLVGQVVLGTAGLTSFGYSAAFGLGTWAALVGAWWLVLIAALAGGAGYAWGGLLWWRRYQGDPAEHGRGGSTALVVVAAVLAAVLMVVLVALR